MEIQEVFHQSLRYLQQGRPADAVRALVPIAASADHIPLIDVALGTAFLDLENHPKAIAAFLRAKKRIPHNFELTYNLARAYRHTGRLRESAEELENCLRHCPASIHKVVLDNLSRTYQALGLPEKALRFAEELFLAAPDVNHLLSRIPSSNPFLSHGAQRIALA